MATTQIPVSLFLAWSPKTGLFRPGVYQYETMKDMHYKSDADLVMLRCTFLENELGIVITELRRIAYEKSESQKAPF